MPIARVLFVLSVGGALALAGCRGGDSDDETLRFPEASDPDAFLQFLNPAPGVPADGELRGSIDNVANFPEAYYNTIDAQGTRSDFDAWRRANGFLTADGQEASCDAPECRTARARFRDTKDLGYGRDMVMRHDLVTGDVAIYVENYQVDAITGFPYGPMNLEALVEGDRSWQFGVNAIEFSRYPYGDGGAPFTKFYNFAGDGKRALGPSGSQQHFPDLDGRGRKSMPTPCIVCHGGQGRTLVVRDDASDELRVAPTMTGRVPGDVGANLQFIERDTLQYFDSPGFRPEENEAAIAAINTAVLSTYRARQAAFDARPTAPGDWDPSFAIEIIENRYPERTGSGAGELLGGTFDAGYVPDGWSGGGGGLADELAAEVPALYRDIVGPNCIVCHTLRGSGLNPSLNFATLERFLAYAEQSDHLTFNRGVMPLGLLNYSTLWDDPSKDTGRLARVLGHAGRVDGTGRVAAPGAPVARIAAPTVAVGIGANGATRAIPLSGRDSAFSDPDSFAWSVTPAGSAEIVDTGAPGLASLRVTATGEYTVTLETIGTQSNAVSSDTLAILVVDEAGTSLPAAEAITFYGAGGVLSLLESPGSCTSCHADNGIYDAIPVHFERCQGGGEGEDDFLYRSVLARVNFAKPLDSLILRKPTNGATNITNLFGSQIDGGLGNAYHAGGYAIEDNGAPDTENHGLLLSWILNGAPRGTPTTPVPDGAPQCVGTSGP